MVAGGDEAIDNTPTCGKQRQSNTKERSKHGDKEIPPHHL